MLFSRCNRLTKTDEFSSVFGFKRAIRGHLFMLHYQPRPASQQVCRLGLVVGKKFLKAAVHRNVVKRLVREQFRQKHHELPLCDLVVRLIAKPARLDRSSRALLRMEIISLFNRLSNRLASIETR